MIVRVTSLFVYVTFYLAVASLYDVFVTTVM